MADRKINRVHELAHQLHSFQEAQSENEFGPSTVELIDYIRSRDSEPPPSARFQKYPPDWSLSKGTLAKAVRELWELISKLEKKRPGFALTLARTSNSSEQNPRQPDGITRGS